MTMQVGLMGIDGIVLASDTHQMNEPIGDGIRHSSDVSKIKINATQTVAICYAKNAETAAKVADRIMSTWIGPDPEAIKKAAQGVLKETKPGRQNVHCLIATVNPCQLYFFQSVDGELTCERVYGATTAGDVANPAGFWKERYYRKNRPIKRLLLLATHLIVSASKLNSGAIEGLEIVICDDGGIRHLSKAALQELEQKAFDLDEELARQFDAEVSCV